MSSKGLTVLGVSLGCLGLGLGVYYLTSKNKKVIVFDASVHTKEKLIHILEDLNLEYQISYMFMYSLLMNLKQSQAPNSGPGDMENIIENVKARLEEITEEKDEDVCKRHDITPAFLSQWIAKFKGDLEVSEILAKSEKLYHDIVFKQEVEEVNLDIPEELTKEVYLRVAQKILAVVRYKTYQQIQDKLTSEGRSQLTESELNEILKKNTPDSFRAQVLKLFKIPVAENENPKKIMQKAFLTYASRKAPSNYKGRNPFLVQNEAEQKLHNDLLERMRKGERIDNIEKDPMQDSLPDIVMNYSSAPGYLKREESVTGEGATSIDPTPAALKYVQRMKEKAKARRESQSWVSEKTEEEEEKGAEKPDVDQINKEIDASKKEEETHSEQQKNEKKVEGEQAAEGAQSEVVKT